MKRKGTSSTTRLRKVHCVGCGCIVRMSRTWIVQGLPTCACGGEMSCPELEDAILIDPDLIDDLSSKARNAVCKALGWDDQINRPHGTQVRMDRLKAVREAKAIPF